MSSSFPPVCRIAGRSSLSSPFRGDDIIFSNSITYFAFFKCDKCKEALNIWELCNLNADSEFIKIEKDKNGKERIICKSKNKNNNNKVCDGIFQPKLKFRFGEELFNQRDAFNLSNKRKTSLFKEIKLLLPSELKQKLFQITKNLNSNEQLDIENLRFIFPNVFWSLIFYFDLNNIDKTFMIPYLDFNANKALETPIKDSIKILDPKKGKVYGCAMWRDGENLIVRGKIAFLGRNQTWLPDETMKDTTPFVPHKPKLK